MVFGEGNPNAAIMLIGEAPGRDEDAAGKPFVGRSGKLLTECIEKAGLKREDVFITNIVKCRPPENRKPVPGEIAYYKPTLLKEIKIVRPIVICTLGSSALESLLNHPFSITKIRGRPIETTETEFAGIIIIPTIHPAYVLRNFAAKPDLQHDLVEVARVAQLKK